MPGLDQSSETPLTGVEELGLVICKAALDVAFKGDAIAGDGHWRPVTGDAVSVVEECPRNQSTWVDQLAVVALRVHTYVHMG